MHVGLISLLCLVGNFGKGQIIAPQTFRIVAPQLVCDVDFTQKSDMQNTNQFTFIRLQPVGGELLCYTWHIRPRILKHPTNQWFNMNAWRSARLVEKSITRMRDEIVKTNIVQINNTLLVPGVAYEFKVLGMRRPCENWAQADERNFNIVATGKNVQFSDSSINGGPTRKGVSIMLVGTDFSYPDQEYILEAQVTFCKPIEDYQFKWNVTGSRGDVTPRSLNGKLLKLPQFYLEPNESYNIECRVQTNQNNEIMANAQMQIKVLKRKWKMQLNFKEIQLSINKNVNIMATLFYSPKDEISFKWKCRLLEEGADCSQQFTTQNTNTLSASFNTKGRYEISAQATTESSLTESSCLIIVIEDTIPEISIEPIKSSYVELPAGSAVLIDATSAGLKPGCELKWKPVQSETLAYFDESSVKGGIGSINVSSLEENFLLELSEFGNETVERDIPLAIPAKSDQWEGIMGDSQYRMRLEAKCLCISEAEVCDETRPEGRTSYVDIQLQTNSPPAISDVTVKPESGTAFLTKFSISTPAAKDKFEDYPILYTFSLKIHRRSFIVGSYFENTIVETLFPYSVTPIVAECKVCDARGACDSKMSKPVEMKYPEIFKEDNMTALIDRYEAMLKRQEYDSVIVTAYGSLEMFKAMDNPAYYMKIVDATLKSLRAQNLLYQQSTRSYEEQTILTYINKVNYLLEVLHQNPEDILQGLLELYNKNILARKRRRRSTDSYNRTFSVDEVNIGFDLMEQVILQSKNKTAVRIEESKLPENIERFLIGLCSRSSRYKFDKKIASFSIEYINLAKKYNIFLPILLKGNSDNNYSAFIKFGRNFSYLNEICLGKVVFPKNYFLNENKEDPRRGSIYGVHLIDKNKNVIKVDEKGIQVNVRLPTNNIPIVANQEHKCCIVSMNKCEENLCTAVSKFVDKNVEYIQCICRALGYYSLTVKETRNITIVNSSTEPVTTSSMLPSTVITDSSTQVITKSPLNTPQSNINTTSIIENPMITQIINKSDDNTEVKGKTGSTGTILVVTLLLACGAFMIGLLLYKRRNNKRLSNRSLIETTSNEEIVESNLSLIDPNRCEIATLSYRSLHDEHLLDGSIETIDRYNDGLISYGAREYVRPDAQHTVI